MFYFIKKQSTKKKVVVDVMCYDWMHFNMN